jgi:hypothetical protein
MAASVRSGQHAGVTQEAWSGNPWPCPRHDLRAPAWVVARASPEAYRIAYQHASADDRIYPGASGPPATASATLRCPLSRPRSGLLAQWHASAFTEEELSCSLGGQQTGFQRIDAPAKTLTVSTSGADSGMTNFGQSDDLLQVVSCRGPSECPVTGHGITSVGRRMSQWSRRSSSRRPTPASSGTTERSARWSRSSGVVAFAH